MAFHCTRKQAQGYATGYRPWGSVCPSRHVARCRAYVRSRAANESWPPIDERGKATAPPAMVQEEHEHNEGFGQFVLLGTLFAAWYAFNIVFNINNKLVLKTLHCPITATAYQFFLGSIMGLLWFALSKTKVDLSKETLIAVAPLALVHTLGNLLTNVSLGTVAVSFTHTIKALEPLFSVLFSFLFLKEAAHPIVLLTLLPIMGGVIGAAVSEASFNWMGFSSAMASNATFQSRNVLSKRFMSFDIKARVGGSIGLFSLITIGAFIILTPFAIAFEGAVFLPASLHSLGVNNIMPLMKTATVAAFTFHMYQQVSYMILARVSPVTHSIGNCVKRVVVIAASVMFFQNPMTLQTKISTLVALLGVFAYSQAKRVTKSTA